MRYTIGGCKVRVMVLRVADLRSGVKGGQTGATPLQARFQVAARRAVEPEAGVAGESGVAAPALPPQSKTRWLQPTPGGAVAGMAAICRGMPAENTMIFGDFQSIPINSNQFQSIPITFVKNNLMKTRTAKDRNDERDERDERAQGQSASKSFRAGTNQTKSRLIKVEWRSKNRGRGRGGLRAGVKVSQTQSNHFL